MNLDDIVFSELVPALMVVALHSYIDVRRGGIKIDCQRIICVLVKWIKYVQPFVFINLGEYFPNSDHE